MRIAHITGVFPPYFAGIGNVCYYNAIELGKLGHDITVFTANYPKGRYSYPNIIMVKRLNYLFKYGNSPFLPRLLEVKDFDIIHLHYPFYFGSEMIYVVSKLRKVGYILTYQMDVLGRRPINLLIRIHDRTLKRRIVSNAKKIIVSSLDYAQHSQIKDIVKKRREDVVEIPNGVDIDKFHPKINGVEIRKKYAIEEDEKIVLFVGGLDKEHYFKGLDYLLRAFSKVNCEDVRLLIVGDGDLKDFYITLTKKLGIYGRTIFAGGLPGVLHSSHERGLPAYYAAADLLVLPSIDMSEAFGLVLVEAMASGKPVVASNLPGVRTVVDHGYNGLLVEPKNIDDLLLKMTYLLDNDDVRELFGKRGRKKAEERYSWQKIAQELDEVYLNVLEEK